MTEASSSTPPVPVEKTEAEMVIDLLRTFQADLKTAQAENKALRDEINLLNTKVNQEIPSQLDAAFKEIQGNFVALTNALKNLSSYPQTTTVAAAAAEAKEDDSVGGVIKGIVKKIFESEGASSGTLSDFDKEILKTSKQIQLMSLRHMLKQTAKTAGVELSEHIVVNP